MPSGPGLLDGALVDLESWATTDNADDSQLFSAIGADGPSAESLPYQADLILGDLIQETLDQSAAAPLGVFEQKQPAAAYDFDHSALGHSLSFISGQRWVTPDQ